jgi:hypothetical protein
LNLPLRDMGILLLSSVVGFGLSISGFWLQQNVSATSFIIVNNLNKVIAVLIGIMMFNQTLSWLALSGVLVSTIGGWLYPISCGIQAYYNGYSLARMHQEQETIKLRHSPKDKPKKQAGPLLQRSQVLKPVQRNSKAKARREMSIKQS